MAVFEIRTAERAYVDRAARFPSCCGRSPLVLRWRCDPHIVCVCCVDPACANHEDGGGVLAADVDIAAKWDRYRVIA